jgi:hypothetical protein
VLHINGAKWVSGLVRCSTSSAFQARVGTGFSSMVGGDEIGVVFGAVLLCTYSAGWFFLFTEFGVVAITLAVMAVGS